MSETSGVGLHKFHCIKTSLPVLPNSVYFVLTSLDLPLAELVSLLPVVSSSFLPLQNKWKHQLRLPDLIKHGQIYQTDR